LEGKDNASIDDHTGLEREDDMSTPTPGPLLARGRTAEVYAWSDNQIVKLFYAWCPPDSARHEQEIGRAIAATHLPTPKLVGAVEIESRQGLIYERVEGPTMVKQSNATPWLVFRFARQFADLHTEMHAARVDGLPRLHAALRPTIEGLEALPPDLKSRVLRLVETLPEGDALCHLDFHPDQVVMTAAGPVIIDWITAHQGDPLADVARTCLLLRFGQLPYGSRAMRAFINLWRGLFYRTYLARYLHRHPGISRREITAWMVPVAAARLGERIEGEQELLLGLIESHLPPTT
jgi:aminoglycoside phosphotransferase (APT) family kinase protein